MGDAQIVPKTSIALSKASGIVAANQAQRHQLPSLQPSLQYRWTPIRQFCPLSQLLQSLARFPLMRSVVAKGMGDAQIAPKTSIAYMIVSFGLVASL
jgi:hypothetical protein